MGHGLVQTLRQGKGAGAERDGPHRVLQHVRAPRLASAQGGATVLPAGCPLRRLRQGHPSPPKGVLRGFAADALPQRRPVGRLLHGVDVADRLWPPADHVRAAANLHVPYPTKRGHGRAENHVLGSRARRPPPATSHFRGHGICLADPGPGGLPNPGRVHGHGQQRHKRGRLCLLGLLGRLLWRRLRRR